MVYFSNIISPLDLNLDNINCINLDLLNIFSFDSFNTFKSLESFILGLELIIVLSISIAIVYSLPLIIFSAPSKPSENQPSEDMPSEQDLEDKIKERDETNDEHSKAGDDDDYEKEKALGQKLEDLDKEIEKMRRKLGK
jgi:hypothetical protein